MCSTSLTTAATLFELAEGPTAWSKLMHTVCGLPQTSIWVSLPRYADMREAAGVDAEALSLPIDCSRSEELLERGGIDARAEDGDFPGPIGGHGESLNLLDDEVASLRGEERFAEPLWNARLWARSSVRVAARAAYSVSHVSPVIRRARTG